MSSEKPLTLWVDAVVKSLRCPLDAVSNIPSLNTNELKLLQAHALSVDPVSWLMFPKDCLSLYLLVTFALWAQRRSVQGHLAGSCGSLNGRRVPIATRQGTYWGIGSFGPHYLFITWQMWELKMDSQSHQLRPIYWKVCQCTYTFLQSILPFLWKWILTVCDYCWNYGQNMLL